MALPETLSRERGAAWKGKQRRLRSRQKKYPASLFRACTSSSVHPFAISDQEALFEGRQLLGKLQMRELRNFVFLSITFKQTGRRRCSKELGERRHNLRD